MRRLPERATALGAGAAVLLLVALFAGESFWLEVSAVAAGAGMLVVSLLGRVPLGRGGGALVGALVGIAAWNGASVAWSIAPDRSWDELNRGLVYVAFAGVGVVLGSLGPRAPRLVAALLAGAFGATVLWALAGKAIPALFPDGGRAARLRDPIGYWNALALVANGLLVLGLWLAASRPERRELRSGGAVVAYAAVLAILLSGSRAGAVATVVGLALWLALGDERTERALIAVAAGVPALAVAGWTFTRSALVEDGQVSADRVADGAVFGAVFLVGVAIVVGAVRALERAEIRPELRRRLTVVLAATAVVAVLAGGAVALSVGDPLDGGRTVDQGPGRFVDAGLNNRREFWQEAWRVYSASGPLTGAGAGTFEIARKRYRDDAVDGADPHNLPLRFLSGTGLVGVALLAALVAAVAAAAVGARRRLDGEAQRAATAIAVLPVLYGVHALVDYDWSFTAVTGPTLLAAGALATFGRTTIPPATRPFGAAAVAVVAVAALVSLATPWLAERTLRDVNRQLDDGDVPAAIVAAERARSLDPLSIEPLHALAGAEAFRRHVRSARDAYAAAVRLQPENPETWYALGAYEHNRGFLCQAYTHLNEAYTLDPRSTRWFPGGPLDEAREFVDGGGCEPRST